MQITITPAQIASLRALLEPVFAAHIDADCELPGFSIRIDFSGPYGAHATGQCGNLTVDLGEVRVQPEQFNWGPGNA